MVKYQVQFKPINPVTKKPVTNTTLDDWTGAATSSTGGYNTNYDMALMFIKPLNSTGTIVPTDFKKIDGDVWAVYAVKESIKAAMKTAKQLIQTYGIENVQICKVVQANVDIIFEEEE
ncbi:hypothetical protein B0P06_006040 [Clostridium saccharoperbutylacetonicum]|jgi:hypothetical protein|uniref:Uncharacterized protein n=1 Tax=Clostridium saccharoperbutylacetonicum N1-4(HMT) TaxID=931276 RepID=M1MTZ6_9CLOT|nr:hypothetical protein [Clostridium saccharoperbutylacetonicum]AGF59578.1 hypothetical protein Cspa_135p00180 [Clostridium saccharoperbutylacetonicum N1-4(HMT)]NRT64565.1 hypothetical protein [Clostridium saccharoperbutylacetonicum]NSB29041.1 hypothetical protein [Clostridium saccharoperbutylacetonicum]NSB46147.1 hypothetical protein [Clostridium saccharoperbutylacetonicum]